MIPKLSSEIWQKVQRKIEGPSSRPSSKPVVTKPLTGIVLRRSTLCHDLRGGGVTRNATHGCTRSRRVVSRISACRFRCFRRRHEALYGTTLPLVITRWLTFNETSSRSMQRDPRTGSQERKGGESERVGPWRGTAGPENFRRMRFHNVPLKCSLGESSRCKFSVLESCLLINRPVKYAGMLYGFSAVVSRLRRGPTFSHSFVLIQPDGEVPRSRDVILLSSISFPFSARVSPPLALVRLLNPNLSIADAKQERRETTWMTYVISTAKRFWIGEVAAVRGSP